MNALDESAIRWSAPPDRRANRPLLLALHGHHGDEHQLAVAAALLPDVVVATPRAPYPTESGGWSWFALNESGIPQAQRVVEELVAWVGRQLPHPSCGVLGLSQGGAIAMALLRRSPTMFDYGAQLSGFAIDTSPAPSLAAVRPPFFSAHGGRDTVIPTQRALDTAEWLRAHTRLVERLYPNLGHTIDPIEVAEAAQFIQAHARRQAA